MFSTMEKNGGKVLSEPEDGGESDLSTKEENGNKGQFETIKVGLVVIDDVINLRSDKRIFGPHKLNVKVNGLTWPKT